MNDATPNPTGTGNAYQGTEPTDDAADPIFPSPEDSALELAECTMIGDLIELITQELKVMPKSWPELGESEQREIIYRAEKRVRLTLRKAVRIIASKGQITTPATVDQVVFKDGAKVVLKGFGPGFHDIADAVNKSVLVVIPESADLVEQDHDVEAEKDQGELEIPDPLEGGEGLPDVHATDLTEEELNQVFDQQTEGLDTGAESHPERGPDFPEAA